MASDERDLTTRSSSYSEPDGWYYITAAISKKLGCWQLTVSFRCASPPSVFNIAAQLELPAHEEERVRDAWDYLDANWHDPVMRQQIFDSWAVLAVI